MAEWAEMPRSFSGIVLEQCVPAVLLYAVLAGANHAAMQLFKRAAEFPGHATSEGQFWPAVKWTLIALGGNAVLAAPVQWWIQNGPSAVYRDVDERGWGRLVVSALLMLAITETAIYRVHRGLHTRAGYRLFQRFHHRLRVPTRGRASRSTRSTPSPMGCRTSCARWCCRSTSASTPRSSSA
jgi:sterol desaturase/sphingolipid hydroxylase (fatty acid hydroxylase superfamily)